MTEDSLKQGQELLSGIKRIDDLLELLGDDPEERDNRDLLYHVLRKYYDIPRIHMNNQAQIFLDLLREEILRIRVQMKTEFKAL